ncbi:RepB family protein, partial [Escherichia coli]|uniref:RepB family protein n=1 Tax=Escherichia coli TaxID=562 RepID=UPI000AC96E99
MSQTENTVTSSSGAKRAYRKGNPLSDAEKQRLSVARKRASFRVNNGLALCSLHHDAFDMGAFGLDENLTIRISGGVSRSP